MTEDLPVFGIVGTGFSASETLGVFGARPLRVYETQPGPGTIFEGIPVESLDKLDHSLDELWVCSQWWREITDNVAKQGFPTSKIRVFVSGDRPDYAITEILDFKSLPVDDEPLRVHSVDRCLLPQMPELRDRMKCLELAVTKAPVEGLFLEFGVFRGESLEFLKEISGRDIFGFDSGVGAIGIETESFAFHGPTPLPHWLVQSEHYIEGWFHQTLPTFLEKNTEEISFVHFDAGHLDPARYVLNAIFPRLSNGAIIAFDEILASDSSRNPISPEWIAFHEAITRYRFDYSWIARSGIRGVVKIRRKLR